MLKTHEKLNVPLKGNNRFYIEVNYKGEDDKETNECKILKLTFPDNTVDYMERDHLNALLFAMGTEAQQRDLLPTKITTARRYQTVLGITAKKDIKRGEKINVQVDIPLPPIEETIFEAAKDMANKHGVLIK